MNVYLLSVVKANTVLHIDIFQNNESALKQYYKLLVYYPDCNIVLRTTSIAEPK